MTERRKFSELGLASASGPARVVVSHPDRDHISLIPMVLGDAAPSAVMLGGCPADTGGCYSGTSLGPWVRQMQESSVPVTDTFPAGFSNGGQPIPELACGGGQTWILTTSVGDTKNSRSMMNYLKVGSFSVIFSGDATDATQESAVANNGGEPFKVAVLTGSHHGATTHGSNNAAWAASTNPLVLVFSAGTKYHHPSCDAARAYEARGSLLQAVAHDFQCGDASGYQRSQPRVAAYDTETDGVITVTSDGEIMDVSCSLNTGCGLASSASLELLQ